MLGILSCTLSLKTKVRFEKIKINERTRETLNVEKLHFNRPTDTVATIIVMKSMITPCGEQERPLP